MSEIQQPIKLFTDPAWMPSLQAPHIWLVQLLWGQLPEESIYQGMGRFDLFFKKMPEIIEWTEKQEEADFWILPADYKQYKRYNKLDILQSIVEKAKDKGKWPVIQYKDDGDDAVPFERLIVLRTSLYRHLSKPHEYAMPVWSEDLCKHYLIDIKAVNLLFPSVGFTGMASKPAGLHLLFFQLLLQWNLQKLNLDKVFAKQYSSAIRYKMLENLRADTRIQCFFQLQRQYIGGSWLSKGNFNQVHYQFVRQDFINNFRKVDYVADFRGGGNYTLRLYETICAGRIPIMLDSDRVLPLEDLINWRQHMLIIPFRKLKQANSILLKHHSENAQNLSELKFANRKLWEDYISPENFYKHIFLMLKSRYKYEI